MERQHLTDAAGRRRRAALAGHEGDEATARALRALDPALLVAGHGKAVRDPQAAMDRAIASA